MSRLCILLLVVGCLAISAYGISLDELFELEWLHFKVKHNKAYGASQEEDFRKTIYMQNAHYIAQHNIKHLKGESSFSMAMNEFGDMLHHEFVTRNGFLRSGRTRKGEPMVVDTSENLPHHWDWRKKGAVTPVKDQGQCGSCWSFSTTGSLEGAHFLKTGELVDLSEQNLVDCSSEFGNNGCNGGMMDNAFQYVIQNKGLDTEESYPYNASQGKCRYNPRNKGTTETSFVDVDHGNETALTYALWKKGPVSIAIDASHRSFQFYHEGIYHEDACSSDELDHGVLAIGFGSDSDGEEFYIVKNSWGERWGMKGYIFMPRNKDNHCGVATTASYPII